MGRGTEPRALRGLIREAFVPDPEGEGTLAQAPVGKRWHCAPQGVTGGCVPAFPGGWRPGGHTGCGPKSHEAGARVGDVTCRAPDWGQEGLGPEERWKRPFLPTEVGRERHVDRGTRRKSLQASAWGGFIPEKFSEKAKKQEE